LIAAWLLFPLVLTALSVGCGLLLQTVAGIRVPGALVPAVGLAFVIVVSQFLTLADATAELATPVAVVMAIAGFAIGLRRPIQRPNGRAVAAAISVFAVFAAPIVLSGEPTFAGYIRLDDTATWMALTDRVMDHGRSLAGLPPSTYEATLSFNLGAGYPIGVFLPLGIGHILSRQDLAWVIQPYLAFLAAILTLGLWHLAGAVIRRSWLRAVVAFLAAQSALLYGYSLWGGIKEVAGAALVASVAGLAFWAIDERLRARSLVPLAVVCGAVIGVLSGGGAIWLAPLLAWALFVGARMLGGRATLRRAIPFAAALVLLSLPVIIPGGLLPPTSSPLTSPTALGNLSHPLNGFQLFGVWPSGDFRANPSDAVATALLIAVVVLAAAGGLYAAWRAHGSRLVGYVLAALAAATLIAVIGSPWVGGKAMAIAAPAIPLAALTGAGALWARGRRGPAAVVLAALAGGILWSNALAYQDVNLAPHGQLAELQTIGDRIAGQGPTLMTEYEPYGARHFLRNAAPEGASELRRHVVPLLSGESLPKGASADTDRFQLPAILFYRTLVLRRSPAQSRPPSPYRLTWRGRYYEVWQRPRHATYPDVHRGLGTAADPGAVPGCAEVHRLARRPGAGSLAAVPRAPVEVVPLRSTRHPSAWNVPGSRSQLAPSGAGTIGARVRVPATRRYQIWLRGSVRPQVDLSIDGRAVGSVRHELNNKGEYVQLGAALLRRGTHTVEIRFQGPDLHPGSGGAAAPIGPLALSSQDAADTRIVRVPSRRAGALCGRRLDWIEVRPP
jgi:hypothetical protein